MTPEKTREIRLRRALARQGYTLSKSRRRDPRALDYGLYIISTKDGEDVFDADGLDDIEKWATAGGDTREAAPVPEVWEQIGEVGVDTGRLMLSDPAYLDQMTADFVNAASGEEGNPVVMRNRNGLGLAMVVGEFGGDGCFPVSVTRTKAGGRITALRVDFTPDEDDQR